ncbi:hypothetical protein SAMN02746091_01390 [Caloramator proteoclasticus DSM 10124]|uniref:Uncharacterized protein n=1 Tax=Caloramator proteoclasticus DSM 10124 TaxID=1121262 RepID=A0A1M4XDL5_9CLOT|nr:hypothetical protein SAMN02746091_01390 [Caloramator proteoclasticus DSM 10124]
MSIQNNFEYYIINHALEDGILVRKEPNQVQYEFNTGWQKVIKSQSESIFDDINSKLKKIDIEMEELKKQVDTLKKMNLENLKREYNEKDEIIGDLKNNINDLSVAVDDFKKNIEDLLNEVNNRVDEQRRLFDSQTLMLNETIKLILDKINELDKKSSGFFRFFGR